MNSKIKDKMVSALIGLVVILLLVMWVVVISLIQDEWTQSLLKP